MRKHLIFVIALATCASSPAQVAGKSSVRMFYREQSASYFEPIRRSCLALNLKTGDLQVLQSVQTWKDDFQDHVQRSEGIVGQTELNAIADLIDDVNRKHLEKVAFPDSFHGIRPLHEVTIELLPEREALGFLDFGDVDPSKLERQDFAMLYRWRASREALWPLVEKLKSIQSLASDSGSTQMEGICDVGPPAEKFKTDGERP